MKYIALYFAIILQQTCSFGQHAIIYGDEKYMDCPYKPKNNTCLLRDTLKDGIYKVYYDSAFTKLAIQAKYINSLKHGNYLSYHENGLLSDTGSFSNGLKNGVWKRFTVKGVLTSEEKYISGVHQDTSIFYDIKGNLFLKNIYDKSGFNIQQLKFHDGKLSSKSEYQKNGNTNITEFYNNNKIKSEEHYIKNNQRNGVWIYWDEKGNIIKKEEYKNDKLVETK